MGSRHRRRKNRDGDVVGNGGEVSLPSRHGALGVHRELYQCDPGRSLERKCISKATESLW